MPSWGELLKRLIAGLLVIWPLAAQTDLRDRNLYARDAPPGSLFKKLGTNVLADQRDIWTSPFRLRRQDTGPALLFALGTAALIASDHVISKQIPVSGTSARIGTDIARAGQAYSVYAFAGSLYFVGAGTDHEKLRDTGLLGVQALVDADIVFNVLKIAVRRQRPLEGDLGGHFEEGGASFPSGHAAQAWAIASVIAHQYGNHRWVPFVAYGYAAAISASRVSGRQHFPSDVFVGSAIGYFIGRYVIHIEKKHLNHLRTH